MQADDSSERLFACSGEWCEDEQGGAGVESALPTDIAIGSPPSEKMPKWLLDKSSQNDKTRA